MDTFKRIPTDGGKQWLELRAKGIGGSDAACILGLNPWKTNLQLYEEKMGIVEPDNIDGKPAVVYGKKAEEHIRELFALDYQEYDVKHTNDLFIHPKYDFLRASLDGELVEKSTGRKGILEIKTTEIMSSFQKEKWKNGVPQNYFCQLLHYFNVTNWDFAVLVAEIKYHNKEEMWSTRRTYYFDRKDLEEDIKLLEKEEINFWNNHILKKVEPPLKIIM